MSGLGRAAVLVVAGLTPVGCDLVDVSFTDGGIVLNPRVFADGGAPPGEGEGLPVPGPQPPGGSMPDEASPARGAAVRRTERGRCAGY